MESQKQFVLIHGACHGAWCWFKLIPLLKKAGHRVTALDLGACGINPKRLDDIKSIFDYSEPLMELFASLPKDEKVILVGHSFGGLAISLAMENFPEKISVAIFVSAYMPKWGSPPQILVQEYFKRTPTESLSGVEFVMDDDGPIKKISSVSFGVQYLSKMMYGNSSLEDLELAKMLMRPTKMFEEDLVKESILSEEKYGSVNRVYVVCEMDNIMKKDFQRWIIQNSPTKAVKSISGADHMVMMSKPDELSHCLLEIAQEFP